MKAEILEKAKKLLPEGQDEEKLSVWAEDVERYICAFCGVGEIPKGCETVAARMLAAAMEGSVEEGALKSITRGISAHPTSRGRERGFPILTGGSIPSGSSGGRHEEERRMAFGT